MNKEQLIRQHPELKLYDKSSLIELRNYKANLKHHQNEGNTTDHLKLIAPFGHALKFKADFYYFESENTPITEQILEEMGFKLEFNCFFLRVNNFFLETNANFNIYLEHRITNIKSANQLFTLIELLK